MKKLIAISFLFIQLYNIGGQLLIHEYLVYQSDKLFNEQIGKNHYNIADLTEIRIPANMSGISDWKSFQNIRGRIQFGNAAYNYVKIKITRTAICLVCIPNYSTTHLSDQNVIDARQISDIPVPKKDHVPFGKINMATYSYQSINYKFFILITELGKTINRNQSFVPDFFITGPGQPPDATTNLA